MAAPISGPGVDSVGRYQADTPTRKVSSQPSGPATEQTPSPIRTPEDAINVLKLRLDQQLQQAMGDSVAPTGAATDMFQPPSAADVAARVLGFVQARLQQEADAGAGSERLADLLSQARAGIEQGFGEARDQIEALGLMNDTLSADIDDSYNRIQDGLTDLEDQFLGSGGGDGTPGPDTVARASLAQVEAASRDALSFEVRTNDGDVVTITMEERAYAGARSASASNAEGAASGYSAVSMFAGNYQFSVQGELDDGERAALTSLFENVQQVSSQFFEGDVQGAFQAAQDLGLNGDELASFSLNLTSVRSVRASTYESVSRQPSMSGQLRPLGGLAQSIRELGQQAQGNGLDLETLDSLMSRIMDDIRGAADLTQTPDTQSLMGDFFRSILDQLAPSTETGDSSEGSE